MIYAIRDGQKALPEPGARAQCPACGGDVLAKCGSIKVWHYSHIAADCDPWSEPETEWHLRWKGRFPPECREVVIGNHRADVRTENGVVIEFQHSSISAEEIVEREEFYGNKMIWVVDASRFAQNFEIFGSEKFFTWKRKQKKWLHSRRPIFFDLSDRVVFVKKFVRRELYTLKDGECSVISVDDFAARITKETFGAISSEEFGERFNRQSLALEIEREKSIRRESAIARAELEELMEIERATREKEAEERRNQMARLAGFSSHGAYMESIRIKREAEERERQIEFDRKKAFEAAVLYESLRR